MPWWSVQRKRLLVMRALLCAMWGASADSSFRHGDHVLGVLFIVMILIQFKIMLMADDLERR